MSETADHRKKTPSFLLVLDGWKENVCFDSLIECMLGHFFSAGIEPNVVSAKIPGFNHIKQYSWSGFRKKRSSLALEHLSVISFARLSNVDDKNSSVFDTTFFDVNDTRYAYILDAITDDRASSSLRFLSDSLRIISPSYGYSLETDLEDRPIFFAQGIFGRTSYLRREARAWQHASHAALGQSLQKHGRFRHVFAINVLSPPHLSNFVDKCPFPEWVSETGFGSLEQWKDDVWVWFVPKEHRIPAAVVLQRNGLLTARPASRLS